MADQQIRALTELRTWCSTPSTKLLLQVFENRRKEAVDSLLRYSPMTDEGRTGIATEQGVHHFLTQLLGDDALFEAIRELLTSEEEPND